MSSHTRSARGEAPSQLRKRGVDDSMAPLVVLAREDFSFYCSFVHRTDMPGVNAGIAEPAAHHLRMIEALMAGAPIVLGGRRRAGRHQLIVAPRDSAKTTLAQWYLEWRLGQESLSGDEDWAKTARFGYVTNAATQAEKVSNAIKDTIRVNERYHLCFPRVQPHSGKWAEPEWKVMGNTERDPNFVATGIHGPVLGSRFLEKVLDDVFGDEERKSRMDAMRLIGIPGRRDGLLDEKFMPMVVPWGRAIDICTRWAEDDGATWAMEQGWETLYMKALLRCEEAGCPGCEEGEHSYWPARYPLALLQEKRRKNPAVFARQYQNEVVPHEGIVFKREWFSNRYEYLPPPEEVMVIITSWDTAGTATGRSYTVGLIVLVTKDWQYYIVDMKRGKMDYVDMRRVIYETHRIYGANVSLIEAKSTGQPAIEELRNGYREPSGTWRAPINVIPILPPGQRGGAALGEFVDQVTVPCDERRVRLPSAEFLRRRGTERWTDAFLDELMAYDPETKVGTYDVVVALSQLLYCVERDKARWEREERMALAPVSYGRSQERAVAL